MQLSQYKITAIFSAISLSLFVGINGALAALQPYNYPTLNTTQDLNASADTYQVGSTPEAFCKNWDLQSGTCLDNIAPPATQTPTADTPTEAAAADVQADAPADQPAPEVKTGFMKTADELLTGVISKNTPNIKNTPLVERLAFIFNLAASFLGIMGVGLTVYGGFQYMLSRGDDKKAKKARDIILYSVVGLLILLTAYSLSSFVVSTFFGAVTSGAQ